MTNLNTPSSCSHSVQHTLHVTLTLSHSLISSFLIIWAVPSSVTPILSRFAQTLPRLRSPAGSSLHAYQSLFFRTWAETHRPAVFHSVTHQATPGIHMLIHIFTHDRPFYLMLCELGPIPPLLYRRTYNCKD